MRLGTGEEVVRFAQQQAETDFSLWTVVLQSAPSARSSARRGEDVTFYASNEDESADGGMAHAGGGVLGASGRPQLHLTWKARDEPMLTSNQHMLPCTSRQKKKNKTQQKQL